MKEKINIYYDTFEPFKYFNEILTIQFFNNMYTVILTIAYKSDSNRNIFLLVPSNFLFLYF
jgi:hypothetical protein